MAYQALYRKYRPTSFSEVVGQEHITKTLKNELSEGKTVHAYLFTGTRGTGKTTCAKILAKAVNCLSPKNGDPCGECEMCKAISEGSVTDISEIDAASNSRVEDIRELRDQVNFAPAVAKYRVYIIDEVHMLSQSAFNALLKTLEEPPEYVIFILATTEIQKLPQTILSRCQRFDFKRIEPDVIRDRIQYIAGKEGFTVTDAAASLIASAADGGMRDALSILDLCASSSDTIDEDVVASVCSMAGNEYLSDLADCIKTGNTESALILLDKLHNSSVDMLRLLSELTRYFRDLMIIKTVKTEHPPIVCSSQRLSELKNESEKFTLSQIMAILNVLQSSAANMQTADRRCEMEMIMIKLCSPNVSNDISSLELRLAALESGSAIRKPIIKPVIEEVKAETGEQYENNDTIGDGEPSQPVQAIQNPESSSEKPLESWSEVVRILRGTCPLIAAVLEGSSAYINGDRLLIDTQNSQFKSLYNGSNPMYRDSIKKAAEQVLGAAYKLGPYRKKTADTKADPLLGFANRLKELKENDNKENDI